MFDTDDADLCVYESLVGLWASSAASLVRSSHLPLTALMPLPDAVAEGVDGVVTVIDLSLNSSFVGLGEATSPSPSGASRLRSSHFPRIISRLFPTRCPGVHRRAGAGGEFDEDPVLLERSDPVDTELLRDRVLARFMDEVRSRSRVWYANWPVESGLELEGVLEDMEFGRSIRVGQH